MKKFDNVARKDLAVTWRSHVGLFARITVGGIIPSQEQACQKTVADLRGTQGTRPPRSKFFQFHAVFGKFWQNHMLAPPPRGNPGSAADRVFRCEPYSVRSGNFV